MLSFSSTQFGAINCFVWDKLVPRDTIIINGNLATYRWWLPALQAVDTKLSNRNKSSHLFIFDLPGCGGHSVSDSIDFLDLVQDYRKLILNLDCQSPPSLLGHSTGGLISAHLDAELDLNFHHVALLNPVGAKGFALDELTLNRYTRMQLDPQYTAKVIGATIYNCDFESDFFKKVIAPDTFSSVKAIGSSIVQSMSGLDSSLIYKKLRSPTTLLYGEYDPLLSLKDMETTADLSSLTQLEVIKNVGHCPNIEDPDLMADIIIRLLF
jgi:3-oxoadipate enol-lactonase